VIDTAFICIASLTLFLSWLRLQFFTTRISYEQFYQENVSFNKHAIYTYQSVKKKTYKELYDN